DVPMDHPVRVLLHENGVEHEGDVILRRIQNVDGRSRVFINDQPSSVTLLRQIGHLLVEIHGQHDDRALVDADAHRDLLDAFGGLSGRVEQVRAAYATLRSVTQELVRHRARVEAAAREADYLRSSVEELAKLDTQPGAEAEQGA